MTPWYDILSRAGPGRDEQAQGGAEALWNNQMA